MYYVITKNHITISIFLAIFFTFSIIYCNSYAKENSSWGLSFGEPNTTPRGNVSQEELDNYDAHYVGNTNEKCVYLTFDAGYEAGFTNTILDVLKKHNIHAAFFVVGPYIKSNPEIVKKMVDEGHIVGNHTNTHPNMSKLSTFEDYTKEMKPVEELFLNTTGKEIDKFYRPPQGVFSFKNLEDAQNYGYTTVFWSLAHVDWNTNNQPSHEKALSTLLGRVHNGSIILLHVTSKTNSEILDEFITNLKNQGYTFKTLDEIKKKGSLLSFFYLNPLYISRIIPASSTFNIPSLFISPTE